MKLRFKDYHQHINQLIQAALAASDPAAAVQQNVNRDGRTLLIDDYTYDLDQGRVFLVSVGKAAVPMGLAAAEILGDDLAAGILVTKKTDRDWASEIENFASGIGSSVFGLYQGGHPVSDEDSVRAARAVTDLLSRTATGDLVLFLISGGASAILTHPMIPLADWQQLNNALLASGCTINDLNCVRRQLDGVKGGGLARAAAPAASVSLILSDVIGNPLEAIGSGPTVLHQDTPADALLILARYGVTAQLESAVWERIAHALEPTETIPEPEPPYLKNLIIGDVHQAADAALIRAAQLGFLTQIMTTRLQGESREVAHVASAMAKDLLPGRCLIMGGETTVTIRGSGRGGRNQEMALAAAIDLEGWPNTVIACFATDGEDGPTSAGGAMVTGKTVSDGRTFHLDPAAYLANNDSHTFFEQLDVQEEATRQDDTLPAPHLIQTGPTGTNVNDLLFILTYPEHT